MCLQLHCVESYVFFLSIPLPSICNQSKPIYLSIGIDDRYQSITTRIFAIDWSSIININQSIDTDCHRLSILSIGYPGLYAQLPVETISQKVHPTPPPQKKKKKKFV